MEIFLWVASGILLFAGVLSAGLALIIFIGGAEAGSDRDHDWGVDDD